MRRRGSAAEAADALTGLTLATAPNDRPRERCGLLTAQGGDLGGDRGLAILAEGCPASVPRKAASRAGGAALRPRLASRYPRRMAVDEAKIEQTDKGGVVSSPGWFILNAADMAWMRDDKGGEWMDFGAPEGEFEQYGIGIHVLHRGQVNGLYHSESVQEDFLVLSGECLLLVEEQERRLKAWDFVHFAPGTRHICIGAGEGPCAILMVGARGPAKTLHYPVTELAQEHGVAAPEETSDPRQAYREWPRNFRRVRATWPV
jgi:uncharacterized cupin superfamily protein